VSADLLETEFHKSPPVETYRYVTIVAIMKACVANRELQAHSIIYKNAVLCQFLRSTNNFKCMQCNALLDIGKVYLHGNVDEFHETMSSNEIKNMYHISEFVLLNTLMTISFYHICVLLER
jgi:hypothetical protein